MNDVTRLLMAAEQGEQDAAEQLLNVVYAELHRMAEQKLSGDAGNHTLQPTALVHDAWLQLVGANGSVGFANRAHFFGAAAEAMRRILIDRARRKQAEKRGGGAEHVDLDSVDVAVNADGDSVAEGIGQTRVTENLKGILIDEAYRITDQMALSIVYQLMREEGIFVGLSSGINVAGALRLASEGGPGQVIVTLLCDSGLRYMSKLFNPGWLRAKSLDPNLPVSCDGIVDLAKSSIYRCQ